MQPPKYRLRQLAVCSEMEFNNKQAITAPFYMQWGVDPFLNPNPSICKENLTFEN
jgi:hypothetical protein